MTGLTDLPKGIFFDLDDTLYDHMIPFRKALQAVLTLPDDFPYENAYHRFRYHTDTLSAAIKGSFHESNTAVMEDIQVTRFVNTLAEYELAITDEQGRRLQDAYRSGQFDIELFDGARELLITLRDQGHVVGVITNGLDKHQMKKIVKLGLDELLTPARIFTSGAVGYDKPDARIFTYVNEKTETVPEHSIYIGDSWRNDVMGTKDTGWTMIWFNHRDALPEHDYRPQHIAKSYAELRRLLLAEQEQ